MRQLAVATSGGGGSELFQVNELVDARFNGDTDWYPGSVTKVCVCVCSVR